MLSQLSAESNWPISAWRAPVSGIGGGALGGCARRSGEAGLPCSA